MESWGVRESDTPLGRAVRRPDSRADREEGSGLWVCAHTNTHTYVVLEVLLLPEF